MKCCKQEKVTWHDVLLRVMLTQILSLFWNQLMVESSCSEGARNEPISRLCQPARLIFKAIQTVVLKCSCTLKMIKISQVGNNRLATADQYTTCSQNHLNPASQSKIRLLNRLFTCAQTYSAIVVCQDYCCCNYKYTSIQK